MCSRFFQRALGLADDETAQAGRALLFSFACLPVGGLLLLWGSRIGNPYLSLAGVATILLAEFIWVVLAAMRALLGTGGQGLVSMGRRCGILTANHAGV